MKIGIMTYWWSTDNYGQLLQCYALQKYLQDLGHEAFLIRYNSSNDYIRLPFSKKILKLFNFKFIISYLFSTICNSLKKRVNIFENKKHPRNFDIFRSEHLLVSELIYTSYSQLKENPPDADIYIVGSDQIWNFYESSLQQCRNILHAFFLDFGSPTIRRISYAASWGKKEIPQSFVTEIKPLLQKFENVTVREKSGITICNNCDVLAKWVIDPTLLLTRDAYRKIYKNQDRIGNQNPYLFFYYVDNGGNFSVDSVYKFAKKNNLSVKYVSGNGNIDSYKKIYPKIEDWLYLLDNAKYVITNSFHCCVISIIFHKQFAVIPLSGKNKGMNERLNSLFELCNISGRYLVNNNFLLLDEPYIPCITDNPIFQFSKNQLVF